MSWPSPVAVKQAATANQYNALLASLQTWGGQVDAANNTIRNLGGFVFSAAATVDASAGGLTILGGLKVTVAAATNVGLTVTSADAARTMPMFLMGAAGAAPALLCSSSNFALRTSAGDNRAIIFWFPAGAEEYISTTSGRLRFTVPLDVDTDIVAGGKVTAASLTVTNSANIVLGANWTAWTPAVSASGAMTVSAITIIDAFYLRIGPIVFVKLYLAFTLAGTADTSVYMTLPVAQVGGALTYFTAMLQILSVAGNYPMPCTAYGDATPRVILRAGSAVNMTLGQYNVMLTGFYRCA